MRIANTPLHRLVLAVPLACSLGCVDPSGGDDEVLGDGDGDGDSSSDGPTTMGDGDGDSEDTDFTQYEGVSILFVIDNSGSMGARQSVLAPAAGQLTDALDAAGIDWRIGVTTSDNGNPWCPAGTTTPEGGKLVLSSCRTRLNDFLYGDMVDVQDIACNDLCSLQSVGTSPTTTELDPASAPRPWIERSGGELNIDAPLEDALACVLPQGVNGCGFESQLESAYLAFSRASSPAEESYGFMGDGSRLPVIVMLTDEADCSYNKSWSDIFSETGNKVFWSDPNAAFPTSAVCWNAGTRCTGDPSGYDDCVPADKDIDGAPTTDPSAAVLQPVARYTQIEVFGAQPLFFGIVGVNSQGDVVYANSPDLQIQEAYGIGPGCVAADDNIAAPPVRVRAVAESLAPPGGRKLYSICGSEYGSALADIGDTIVSLLAG